MKPAWAPVIKKDIVVFRLKWSWKTFVSVMNHSSTSLISLSSSRSIGASDVWSSGDPVRSHGNPFLSCPQAAGGGSSGTKLSKPVSKPQLKSLKSAIHQGGHLSECASPSVHTGWVGMWNWRHLKIRKLQWFTQYNSGRSSCCFTAAILMHSDLIRLSNRAPSLLQPYMPTP